MPILDLVVLLLHAGKLLVRILQRFLSILNLIEFTRDGERLVPFLLLLLVRRVLGSEAKLVSLGLQRLELHRVVLLNEDVDCHI